MRALFSQLLDLLYPPKCVFCRRLLRPEEHDVCARCAHELEPIPAPLRRGQFYTECYAVYPYEGVVAESLRRFKFSGQSQYAASFGRMLAPLLRTAPFEILSWVPVSAKRRRSRGKGGNKPQSENAETDTEKIKVEPIEHEPFVATPEEELTDTAKNARAFLKELTVKMNVPAEIEVSESAEQLKMVLSGENMSILIGRRGETLDAIQYLTSLNVNRGREDYLRVSLDTENYRAKREEALRKLAVRMANRCKKSGRRVALEPMNPYERRILHSALQADPEVTTHSEGEEPYRRVIITLNNQK